jgi:deazaflavin-dependent oxidoreductase (nitroreductase family)
MWQRCARTINRERGEVMTLFGQDHVARYVATGGTEGYQWRNGTTILLLTTTGAKSGRSYTHPLIYRDHGDDYLIVASKGGADAPPSWYVNLSANPDVEVQIKGEKFAAHARTATADEKPELWAVMTEAWPDYDEYQTKTSREIPVVVLERA